MAADLADKATMMASNHLVRDIVAATTLLVAFLLMASIFVPAPLAARGVDAQAVSAAHSTDGQASLRSLGRLENEQYTVNIYATPAGPLYSVYTPDGVALATLITAAEVSDRFSDLKLPDARADAGLKLMDTSTGEGDW